jgi:hypothetical protein
VIRSLCKLFGARKFQRVGAEIRKARGEEKAPQKSDKTIFSRVFVFISSNGKVSLRYLEG